MGRMLPVNGPEHYKLRVNFNNPGSTETKKPEDYPPALGIWIVSGGRALAKHCPSQRKGDQVATTIGYKHQWGVAQKSTECQALHFAHGNNASG